MRNFLGGTILWTLIYHVASEQLHSPPAAPSPCPYSSIDLADCHVDIDHVANIGNLHEDDAGNLHAANNVDADALDADAASPPSSMGYSHHLTQPPTRDDTTQQMVDQPPPTMTLQQPFPHATSKVDITHPPPVEVYSPDGLPKQLTIDLPSLHIPTATSNINVVSTSTPVPNTHPMITRSKAASTTLVATVDDTIEPSTVRQGLTKP